MINSVAGRKAVASITAAVWLVSGGQGISYGQSPVEGGKIYWTDLERGIFRSNLDGSNSERLVKPDVRYPGDIALDVLGGKMYWTDRGGGAIYWSDLDGSNLETLVDVWETAMDLALDIAGGKLYWTDSFNADDYYQGALMRANLDGSNIEALIEDFVNRNPGTIALDLVRGKVYWIDRGSIYRADLDGKNEEIIVRSPVGHIALDGDGGKIYWTDSSAIHRADLDGKNEEEILTGLAAPPARIALDLDRSKIYWTERTDSGSGSIRRADLDGENVESLILEDTNVRFCFGFYRDRYRVQGCRSPYSNDFALDVDEGKLYWTDGGAIRRTDLDGTNVEHLFGALARAPHRLALDAGKMYWTDLVKGTIQCSDLNGSNIEVLITGLDHPRGVVLLGKNKIYWVNSGAREFLDHREIGKIQAANLDGTNIEDIVTGLSYPDDIVLDAVRGTIYWTTLWDHVIRRADLDGSNIEEVLAGLGGIPRGITLDLAGDKIYWTEDYEYVAPSKVRRSNLDGSNIEDIVADMNRGPYGDLALDLIGNKIYWVSLVQPPFYPPSEYPDYEQMFRSNLDGSNIEGVGEWGTGGIGITLDIPRPTSVLAPDSLPGRPTTSGLLPNYPNPFNASTQIAYHLATPGLVRLAVYNALGQPVRTLVNQFHAPGSYQAPWDARDQQGAAVATGVYFTRLYYPGGVETRRLLYFK